MNSFQFDKLSSDLRALAVKIPLGRGSTQNDKFDTNINLFELDTYEALESAISNLEDTKKFYFRRHWYMWRCAQCDAYLFTVNVNAESNPKDRIYNIIFHRSLGFEIKSSVIPRSFHNDIQSVLANPQEMIDFFYDQQDEEISAFPKNRLFIVHHSFVDPNREFYLRCAWGTKRKLYEFFVNNFHNINFRNHRSCRAGVIFLLEQQKNVIYCVIDGFNNNKPIDMKFDKAHWKELDINIDSLWLIGPRAKGGKRENNYHGNFTPQVPDNLIRRYTEAGEIVMDLFMGSGTTLYECETLGRNYIGYDINEEIIQHVSAKMDTTSPINYHINKCDVTDPDAFYSATERSLLEIGKKKVDFLIVHPPYWNIIHFTDQKCDLSNISNLDEFINKFTKAMSNALSFLKANRHFAIVVGDLYRDSAVVPLGFYLMDAINKNFKCKLKGIVIKDMVGNRAKIGSENLWRYKALKSDYFLFKHEYIFVFRKA